MDFILTVEDYPRAKPHPDPYLSALRRFQVTADQAIVVEDSARGFKSAVAAGVDCIVVHNEFTASHDLSAATLKIEDIRGVAGDYEGPCITGWLSGAVAIVPVFVALNTQPSRETPCGYF